MNIKLSLIATFLFSFVFIGENSVYAVVKDTIVIIHNGQKASLIIDSHGSNQINLSNIIDKIKDAILSEINNNQVENNANLLSRENESSISNNEGGSISEIMIALKEKYPEGMKWTNDNYYEWKGGIYNGGYGCAAFAYMLSDIAFGNLPARKHTNFNDLRIGDIMRMDSDTHYVIIINKDDTNVVLAEGNFNSSIHWGRKLSLEQIKAAGNYILTRYPE